MTCPFCRSSRLLEISVNLESEAVTMHSCPSCESRWWDRGGERVPLRSVLDLVASR